jgi:RimJ/RimL family protein N-acetyltransferase
MPVADLEVPILETPRLILRGHRLDDFPAMVEIWSDPVVQLHFHGQSQTREDIWSKLLRHFGMWAAFGYGMFAVEEKASGAYVGTVGTFDGKRQIELPIEGMPEAGWTLASRVHGKGYATEATAAALAWTDDKLGFPSMFCIVAANNAASIRVAEKCGFERWCETTYKDDPTVVFRRQAR